MDRQDGAAAGHQPAPAPTQMVEDRQEHEKREEQKREEEKREAVAGAATDMGEDESERMEPGKHVRVEPAKMEEERQRKQMDGETEADKAEGDGGHGHKSCAKDENGFVYYKCRFCGLTFNFMTTLKAHERVHDVVQPYTCNKCGEAFHFMCELEYHAKSHLAQKGYKCECGRTFFQYTDLLYHRHPGEDPEPEQFFVAPAPPPPFSSTSSMLAPSASMPAVQSSRSTSDFPTPEFMEKGFEPKHQLRVWSDVRSKPYICQYCSKSYADSRGLAYHMYSHRGERMFNPRASRYLMCRNELSYMSPGVDLNDA